VRREHDLRIGRRVDPCVDDGVDTLALDRQECLAVRIHQVFATATSF
jgi:hypothetical protein